jgi:hypothetical protein
MEKDGEARGGIHKHLLGKLFFLCEYEAKCKMALGRESGP